MPLMLLSNPGLHLALLGNPKRKARISVSAAASRLAYFKHHRNPKRKAPRISVSAAASRLAYFKHHHNPRSTPRTRRNPMGMLGQYVSAAKRAPQEVLGVFKGRNKIKHIAFAAGGAVGTFALGGILTASVVAPALSAVGAGRILASPMARRVIGGMMPFTVGYIASKFVKGDIGKALLVGGAAASLLELVSPGMVARLVYRTPVVGPVAVAAAPAAAVRGPVNGLDGYVDAKAYQGTGEVGDDLDGYVDAKAYQGTGDDLDGYVDAKNYQGTGDDMADDLAGEDDDLAGVDGYLTDSSKYMETYLN